MRLGSGNHPRSAGSKKEPVATREVARAAGSGNFLTTDCSARWSRFAKMVAIAG